MSPYVSVKPENFSSLAFQSFFLNQYFAEASLPIKILNLRATLNRIPN